MRKKPVRHLHGISKKQRYLKAVHSFLYGAQTKQSYLDALAQAQRFPCDQGIRHARQNPFSREEGLSVEFGEVGRAIEITMREKAQERF